MTLRIDYGEGMPTMTWSVDVEGIKRRREEIKARNARWLETTPVSSDYFKLEDSMDLLEALKRQQQAKTLAFDVTKELAELLSVYTCKEQQLKIHEDNARNHLDYQMVSYLEVKKAREEVSEKLSKLKRKMKISDETSETEEEECDDE